MTDEETREPGQAKVPPEDPNTTSPATGTPNPKTGDGVAQAAGLPAPSTGAPQGVPRAAPAEGGAPSDPGLERRIAAEQTQAAGEAKEAARPGEPTASLIAAAKAKAAALAAARAAGGKAGAPAPAAKGAPAPIPLPPELQAFADVVQAGVAGLERDTLSVGLPAFRVTRADMVDVCRALRALPGSGLDYLACLSGVDYPDHIDVVYHLFSVAHPGVGLVLKVAVPKEGGAGGTRPDASEVPTADLPWLPSVTGIWPGAEWHEREVFDLLGVRFDGHPDLRRILMPEGFTGGYPLRKDYVDRREQRVRKVRAR